MSLDKITGKVCCALRDELKVGSCSSDEKSSVYLRNESIIIIIIIINYLLYAGYLQLYTMSLDNSAAANL